MDVVSDSHWANLNERQRHEFAAAGRGRNLTPNPAMISMLLDARELDAPEVDIACGVVEPAVDLWEEGKLVPTPAQVRALAELTGVHPGLFYEEAPGGRVFICARSGPNRGCHVADSPYARPAQVVPLHKDTLW